MIDFFNRSDEIFDFMMILRTMLQSMMQPLFLHQAPHSSYRNTTQQEMPACIHHKAHMTRHIDDDHESTIMPSHHFAIEGLDRDTFATPSPAITAPNPVVSRWLQKIEYQNMGQQVTAQISLYGRRTMNQITLRTRLSQI